MLDTTTQRIRTAVVFIALSLSLLFLEARGALTWLPNITGLAFAPFQSWSSFTYFALRNQWRNTQAVQQASDSELLARVQELEAQVAQLTAENIQLKEVVAERDRLAKILGYEQALPNPSYAIANVIGADPSPFFGYILLDRGTTDGVLKGMPVVSAEGLVGVVVESYASFCKVMLITDPRMKVNVRVQENRTDGIVSGQEAGGLRLQYIAQSAELADGQTVITSGLAGSFPAGIPIGTLRAIRKRPFDVFQEADVVPFVDFHRLETALIITDFETVDISPALTPTTP
jgi:rod shape-determining protein MreC